MFEKFHRS